MIDIKQGDCLELMKALPDASIDAIITDPPYNIGKASWDKIPDYMAWCNKWLLESQRVLKSNGSIYIFHNEMPTIAKLMVMIESNTRFIFKQMIVWNKKFHGSKNEGYLQGYNEVEALRNYQKMAEYILYYTFQDETGLTQIYGNNELFASVRNYMQEEKLKAGLKTCRQINRLLEVDEMGGGMASHYFSRDCKQWALPTGEMYLKLQSTGYFQKPYESLRAEYESLRYTFNNLKTHHSIWNYDIEEKQGHITPKPLELIKTIIKYSSKEGDTILDLFMGSGTTGVACKQLNRNFIGFELNESYFNLAKKRIEEAEAQKILINV